MATGGGTDHSPSPLVEFPSSKAYGLQFIFCPQVGTRQVITDENSAVLLDSERKQTLEELGKTFKVTGFQVDEQKRLIILTDRASRRSLKDTWITSVKDKICSEIGIAEFRIFNVGNNAEELRRRIVSQDSITDVLCDLSSDRQKILLVSTNPLELETAVKAMEHSMLFLPSGGEFRISSKLRVSVFRADITQLNADGIVSAIDKEVSFSGGVSLAIAKAAGKTYTDEVMQYKNNSRPLGVGGLLVTKGGDLRCKKVLHAVGPRWEDYKDETMCRQLLTDTVFNCLQEASRLKLTTLGIPAISSRTFQVPPRICGESYRAAVEKFDMMQAGPQGDRNTLNHIVFVDIDDSKVPAIRKSFMNMDVRDATKELRIAIVGKMGIGKSALGNNLLNRQDAFKSEPNFEPVTQTSRRETVQIPGYRLEVVDTPGLFDLQESGATDTIREDQKKRRDTIQKETIKSLSLLLPGPHIILVVFKFGRFSPTEASIYSEIQKLFPNLYKYMIVVFTYVNDEEKLNRSLTQAKHLGEGLLPKEFEDLMEHCEGRVAAIDNKAPPQELDSQVTNLRKKILDLHAQNSENYYTDELTTRCLQLVMIGDKTLDEIKQDISDGREDILERVRSDPKTQERLDKAGMCIIL